MRCGIATQGQDLPGTAVPLHGSESGGNLSLFLRPSTVWDKGRASPKCLGSGGSSRCLSTQTYGTRAQRQRYLLDGRIRSWLFGSRITGSRPEIFNHPGWQRQRNTRDHNWRRVVPRDGLLVACRMYLGGGQKIPVSTRKRVYYNQLKTQGPRTKVLRRTCERAKTSLSRLMHEAEQCHFEGTADGLDFSVKNIFSSALTFLVIPLAVHLSHATQLLLSTGSCQCDFLLPVSSAMARIRLPA